MFLLRILKERLFEVLKAVAPLFVVALVFQLTLVDDPSALAWRFVAGSAIAVVGMLLLFAGIDMGVLPMGRFIGAELPERGSRSLIIAVAFALGFATTLAEPDVLVFARQVEAVAEDISGRVLSYIIAIGVGVFSAIALLRVVHGFSMRVLLSVTYSLMIILSLLAPSEFVPLAYDAGSVTTGVLTAPVVLALALGLSAVLAGRSGMSDAFGLLGFASVGPIIAVLVTRLLLP